MLEMLENRDYLLHQHIKKEKMILKKLCFNEFVTNVFKFYEGNYILFVDYRNGKRRSWAISLVNARLKVNKHDLYIYNVFKEMIRK